MRGWDGYYAMELSTSSPASWAQKYLLQLSIKHNRFAETSDISMAYPHARLAKAILATYPHGYEPSHVNGKKPIFLLILAAIYGLPPSGALYQSFRNKKILYEFG